MRSVLAIYAFFATCLAATAQDSVITFDGTSDDIIKKLNDINNIPFNKDAKAVWSMKFDKEESAVRAYNYAKKRGILLEVGPLPDPCVESKYGRLTVVTQWSRVSELAGVIADVSSQANQENVIKSLGLAKIYAPDKDVDPLPGCD
jgi:hypothetical protein